MELLFDLAAGFLAGIFASMGLGGGVVLMIYLRLAADFSQLAAQGLNLAFFLPIGGTAAVVHMKNGLLSRQAALWCIPSGLVGAVLAALLVSRLPEQLLSRLFACLLLWIGAREIFSALRRK